MPLETDHNGSSHLMSLDPGFETAFGCDVYAYFNAIANILYLFLVINCRLLSILSWIMSIFFRHQTPFNTYY